MEGIELSRIPEAPAHMNEVARGYWKDVCESLKSMGNLTRVVLGSAEAYCNHLADMQKARQMMDSAWGSAVFFKYQKAYIEANKQQIVIAKELGFTPLSKKKMPKVKEKKKGITDGI
jgi:phage terminase small subunit